MCSKNSVKITGATKRPQKCCPKNSAYLDNIFGSWTEKDKHAGQQATDGPVSLSAWHHSQNNSQNPAQWAPKIMKFYLENHMIIKNISTKFQLNWKSFGTPDCPVFEHLTKTLKSGQPVNSHGNESNLGQTFTKTHETLGAQPQSIRESIHKRSTKKDQENSRIGCNKEWKKVTKN